MSEIKVTKISDRAGTGAPDFTYGLNVQGVDSGISPFTHTEGATEPSSPSNGDTWWDSANELYYVYVNNEWTAWIGTPVSLFTWGGDRGVVGGGFVSGVRTNSIEYFDITTEGNTSDFGDLSAATSNLGSTSNSTRGVFMGGSSGTARNVMEYITISTTGNTTDFGDLTSVAYYGNNGVVSDGTYGLFHKGYTTTTVNSIDYITIATTGNATDFGDRTEAVYGTAGLSDATYGVFAGGNTYTATMDYVTIASPGNATDFGDLTVGRKEFAGASDETRGVFLGGQDASTPVQCVIDYITISTTGNATDFGDFTTGEPAYRGSASSNGTRAVYGASLWYVSGSPTLSDNRQEFVVIQTTGNATDFGDMTTHRTEGTGLSGAAA